jgi:hypothetical protein
MTGVSGRRLKAFKEIEKMAIARSPLFHFMIQLKQGALMIMTIW